MKINYVAVGMFLLIAVLLFTVGLFLIGDRQRAFSRHIDFYTDLADVNGLAPGSKVRVDGFDAGQLESLIIPDRPSGKFHLKLHLDDNLRRLIRNDSVVTVESDGLVGDKFLQIHGGFDQSIEASSGTTLPSKEPVEISAMLEKVSGVVDQASGTITDVHNKLNVTLDTATATIGNVNGLVTEARHGNGPVGILLNDQQTAAQLKQTVANAESAAGHINQITVQAGQLVTDLQSRNLPAKIDDTVGNARDAAQQLDQTSQKINTAVSDAFAPDSSGQTAGENLRNTLSNVNVATANLSDDTEALKHGFLFRGFFKKRGYYNLNELTPDGYRTSSFFQSARNRRFWVSGTDAFALDAEGSEALTDSGKAQIDQIVGTMKDSIVKQPLVIEGYSTDPDAAKQIMLSSTRARIVKRYLVERFHLHSMNIGIIPLNALPPRHSGKGTWDGVCLVVLPEQK